MCLVNTFQHEICSVIDRKYFPGSKSELSVIYTVTSLRAVLFINKYIMFPEYFSDVLKLYFTISHRLLAVFNKSTGREKEKKVITS